MIGRNTFLQNIRPYCKEGLKDIRCSAFCGTSKDTTTNKDDGRHNETPDTLSYIRNEYKI